MTFSKFIDASFNLSQNSELLSQVSDVLDEVSELLTSKKQLSVTKTKTANTALMAIKDSIKSHKDSIDCSMQYIAPVDGIKKAAKMINDENQKKRKILQKNWTPTKILKYNLKEQLSKKNTISSAKKCNSNACSIFQ